MLTVWQWSRWRAGLPSEGQQAFPESTVSAGGWTAVGGATLHAVTADASDSSYAESSTGIASDPATVALEDLQTPVAGTVTLHVRYGAP